MSENKQKYLSDEFIAQLDKFNLRARLIVEGFITGLHKSPYHGFRKPETILISNGPKPLWLHTITDLMLSKHGFWNTLLQRVLKISKSPGY